MTTNLDRVLCVHSGGETLRGSEWALLDMLQELLRQKKRVLLLCDQQVLRDKARELEIDAHLISYGEIMLDGSNVAIHPLGLLKSNIQIYSHARKFGAKAIYCNGGRALQMAYGAAKLARIPKVVHLHSPYSKRYLYLYGVTRADLVIHCSDNVRVELESKVTFRSSVALRNAVSVASMPSPEEIVSRPPNPVPVIGFFGSLIPRKGLDILIEAVAILVKEGLRCTLKIGGIEHSDEYRNLVQKMGIVDFVEFVGEIPRAEVATFFNDVDLHVLPSRSDAMPLSIIEAAICGVPTIAHDVGGISEALMEGAVGILYQNNTAENLAKIIDGAIKDSPWMTPEKRKAIANIARTEFNLENNAKKLLDMLASPRDKRFQRGSEV